MTESKEDRPLPVGKLSVDSQILVLRSYVAYYEREQRSASYKDIAAVSQINETNVSSCKGFWESVGLLIQEDGKSRPSPAAIEFHRRYSSDIDGAWQVFRSAIKDCWFVKQLAMSMQLNPVQTEKDIIAQLVQATGASKPDKKVEDSVRKLVDILKTCRFLEKKEDGDNLTIRTESLAAPPLKVLETNESLIVVLGNDRYAVDSSMLKAFVKEHGKRTTDTDYKLE